MMQGFICRGGEIKQSLNMTQHQVCEVTWERIVLSASFFFPSVPFFISVCERGQVIVAAEEVP